jgi:hypothetical protein
LVADFIQGLRFYQLLICPGLSSYWLLICREPNFYWLLICTGLSFYWLLISTLPVYCRWAEFLLAVGLSLSSVFSPSPLSSQSKHDGWFCNPTTLCKPPGFTYQVQQHADTTHIYIRVYIIFQQTLTRAWIMTDLKLTCL